MVHEIKSAIILAAGRGKRLENLTDEQPKPLCKVRGEVLIERLIEQLQAKGIDDIYVVVGYKYWKFDYLNEKYGITLVYNKKWFCTNNIISFIKGYEGLSHCSKSYSTVMLDADLYIEDDSVIETKINYSGYYLEYCDDEERCMKEWVANISGAARRKIYRVITDGSCKSGYVLRSLSFWTPMDMAKLYELAKEATKDGKNMQCYIDNIPCVLYDDKFDLCAYVADKPALLEIDTTLDYEQANKETNNEENS